jgi:putative FmdB family regulatory protein
MPIYEYECADCGKKFEIFQKISEEPLKDCNDCGGRLHRLISMCSFQLKGTGWYVTDYKSPASAAKGNGAKQEGDKHGEKADKAEKTEKAESKPEAKPEGAKSEASGGAA